MRVCAVTWGAQPREQLLGAGPHWCVDDWAELLALLDPGGWASFR